MKTAQITYTIPALDMGESQTFNYNTDTLRAEDVVAALNLHDAQLAGLPVEEAAGFEVLSFTVFGDEVAVVLRTCGLGPKPEDNTLVIAHAGFI